MAVVACNLAEVLGMACGLSLLFHIPLPIGACITAIDVMLVPGLQQRGVRQFEALIIALVALVGACFALQVWWLQPGPCRCCRGVAADESDLLVAGHALPGCRHHWSHGHAPQPLSALVYCARHGSTTGAMRVFDGRSAMRPSIPTWRSDLRYS